MEHIYNKIITRFFFKTIIGVVLFFVPSFVIGQVYFHDFGTVAITTNPYTVAPNTINANLNSSQWSSSTGAFTSFTGNTGQALSLANSSGTPSLSLTFNVAAGCSLDITSFNFWRQRSSSGAQTWTLTINGIVVGNGTVPTTGAFIGNTAVASAVNGLTGVVSVVLSVSGASGTGTFRLDDFTLNGSTTCGGTPHTVTFNTNGGTGGSMSNQTASSSTNLTSNAFTKTGCTFAGWNTAANGSGTSYTDGQAYNFLADLTLYAQWNCGVSHTVTFDINGGTGGSTAAQTASSATNLTTNGFTKTGCVFSGWNTVAGGGGTAYSNGQSYSFAADLTLYAQWNCSPACPHLQAAVINACPGSCNAEGTNEFLVFNSGSYSIPVTPANIQLVYSGGSPALQNFTQSFAAQPSIITNLNSLAGCGTLFVDVSNSGTIPANSTFFIMNQGSCFNSGSFASYCGVGTIYVAFSTDASWSSTGYFGNNTTPRYFTTDFSGVNSGCGVTTYSYNNGSTFDFGAAGDGSSVVFSGTTPSYITGNGACVPPNIILPIELIDFYATKKDKQNDIIWKVAEETNVESYMIEKSEDGINFYLLENRTLGQSKTDYASIKTYSVVDENPFEDYTYYRLGTKGKDGSVNYHKIISVDEKSTDWKSNYYQQNQNLFIEFKNNVPKNSIIQLFDLSGKLLVEENITNYKTLISTQALAEGLYFIKIQSPYKTENFKIIIQK